MIEDVEYLKDHCEKDSATFYIDTAQRNREYFPTPSEFCIDFEQPYKLVNGFDVLDAAVPTTMYNVDGSEIDNVFIKVDVSSGPPSNARKFFLELTESVTYSAIFECKIDGVTLLVCNPSVLSSIQGVVEPVNENTYIQLKHAELPTKYFLAIRQQLDDVGIKPVQQRNLANVLYFDSADKSYYVNETNSSVKDIIQQNNFKVMSENGVLSMVYFKFYYLTRSQYDALTQSYIIKATNIWKSLEEGNYDVSTLRNDMNVIFNDSEIFLENTTTVEKKQGKYRIWSSSYIVYNARTSGMASSMGFDLLPSKNDSKAYETYPIGKNTKVYAGVWRPEDMTWAITAPGLVNLLGERFVILRCKEIEDHLLGSLAYSSFTPGIGMFKLAAAYNDITNLRFDFVNLVRKPFHPIGKLNKMTFRFETSNGRLYDFKGVNVQMLLMLKFLVPTQKFKFEKSILNPNYDPNFMVYMSKNKTIEYKEDSDDEEDFDTERYRELYRKEFEKQDYSTSEDESEDSEDSEEEVSLSRRRGNTY